MAITLLLQQEPNYITVCQIHAPNKAYSLCRRCCSYMANQLEKGNTLTKQNKMTEYIYTVIHNWAKHEDDPSGVAGYLVVTDCMDNTS